MDRRLQNSAIVFGFMLHLFLFLFLNVNNLYFIGKYTKSRRSQLKYNMKSQIPSQIRHLSRIIELSDTTCVVNFRMSRNALGTLCYLLEHSRGLKHSRNVCIDEKVVMFLSILAHHKKIRIIGNDFQRYLETVSKHFHEVLSAVLLLHKLLLATTKPVDEACIDEKWQCFKGCIGALDETYVDVRVRVCEHVRYRNRKSDIAVNVLGACDRDIKFIYLLPGWEGSAANSRVLRDALCRPHGLRVSRGSYYLCDNGYTNGEGFLTPYRGVRYHLKEWGPASVIPQNAEEYFNMKHSRARNVIERCFGLLKIRWAVLRSPTFETLISQPGVEWDKGMNVMVAPTEVWTLMSKNSKIIMAYKATGEPEWELLSKIFGTTTHQVENSQIDVVQISDNTTEEDAASNGKEVCQNTIEITDDTINWSDLMNSQDASVNSPTSYVPLDLSSSNINQNLEFNASFTISKAKGMTNIVKKNSRFQGQSSTASNSPSKSLLNSFNKEAAI